jgi:hypothetical protein
MTMETCAFWIVLMSLRLYDYGFFDSRLLLQLHQVGVFKFINFLILDFEVEIFARD